MSNYRAYYYRPNPASAMGKPATEIALTAIEAAGRIDRMLFENGLVTEDGIMLSDRVLAYAYALSRQKNWEVYSRLHDRYDVKAAVRKMLSYPCVKKKCVAFLYLVLGKKRFFSFIGKTACPRMKTKEDGFSCNHNPQSRRPAWQGDRERLESDVQRAGTDSRFGW